MRYLGGKHKISNQIVTILEKLRKPNQLYVEPFVGGAHIISKMSGHRVGSDSNIYTIEMLKKAQQGFIFPQVVTEKEYLYYKNNPSLCDKGLRGFIGFGCSFAGKWFGGYAKDQKRNYAGEASRYLNKISKSIKNIKFYAVDYKDLSPKNRLIYCDPPYQGTTSYGSYFDHNEFWDIMRDWSKENTVVISEYSAPSDFKEIAQFPKTLGLRTKKGNEIRTEKLFTL